MITDNHLRSPHTSLSLLEALQLPASALLGVDDDAATALSSVGINSIFDLGTSALFAQAATAAGLASAGFDRVPNDLLKDTPTEPTLAEVPSLPLSALRALTDTAAADLSTALDVDTIKEFAFWPPRVVAHQMVGEAFGGRFDDPQDAAADKLRPQLGEYPTERVYFNTLVMLGMANESANTPLANPLSLDAIVDNPVGFGKPAIGALATYAQSWFAQGITLGHMIHSLALAPGEATRIAVIDWSRRSRAATTESVDEAERLSNSMDHSRAISEVQNAVANEMQSGASMTSGWAHSESRGKNASASIGGGLAGMAEGVAGVFGFGGGGSTTRQESDTQFGASSSSWSVGTRSVMAQMSQRVNDRTEQHASSVRNRRASAIREVSQSEHEEISTRVVANYNHMHALTVQYYEIVQVYRVMTELHAFKRVVFVPFQLLDFTKPNADNVVSRFRSALLTSALTPRVRALLRDPDGSIEIRSGVRVEVAPTASVLAGTVGNVGALTAVARESTLESRGVLTAPGGVSTSPGGVLTSPGGVVTPVPTQTAPIRRKVVRPGPIAEIIPGNAKLVSLSFEDLAIDRVRIDQDGVAAADSTFMVPANTGQIDFPGDIPLRRVNGISVATSDGVEATGTMFVRYETGGRQFSFAVPTEVVLGTRVQRVAYLAGDSADRRSELMSHLQANRGYYTQAVLRNVDSASLVMLLSGISWLGKPLADQIEPKPISVTGNYLVLGAPAESDDRSGLGDVEQTWGDLLRDREITFNQQDRRIIPIPTGGVFAEAVLGRSNSAEKLDITRFWNWQDSPIPLQPPEIAPVTAGSRKEAETLTPGQLGSPLLNIMTPSGLPDPAGLSAVLTALANGNMFRDQSGLAGTQSLAEAASTGTLNAATEAGRIASENFKAVTQQATEMGKAAADMWKISKSKNGNGSGGPASGGISGDGARINQGRDLDRRGVTDAPASSNGNGPRVSEVPTPVFAADGNGNQPPVRTTSRELMYSDEAVAASPALLQQTAAGLSAGIAVASPVTAGNPMVAFFERVVLGLIRSDAAAANISLQGAKIVPMRFHDNHKEFSSAPVSFSAWTNSPQHIYLNVDWLIEFQRFRMDKHNESQEQAVRSVRAAAVLIIRHEIDHVVQFQANSGNPPTTFKGMIDFEHQAYQNDVAWLQNSQTVNFLTNTLQVSSSLISYFLGTSTDAANTFDNWKTTITGTLAADEATRKNVLINNELLPATIKGKTNYVIADLYKTAPPPP